MKFKDWNGKDLKGEYDISIKRDGVRAHQVRGKWISRTGKPLYNIPKKKGVKIAEIDIGSFKETVSVVRSKPRKELMLNTAWVYGIDPIDDRLYLYRTTDPCAAEIMIALNQILEEGYEGLVLRKVGTNNFIKVKKKYSLDVKITGIIEGKGKHKGRLGKFLTEKGGVGTGFTDEERDRYFNGDLIGKYVEVECMELTESGMFRCPRFIRLRPDKDDS